MDKKLSFAIENIELIKESNNSQFATLKIDAFASGINRHSLYISEDTLRKTADTILQKPIVWSYSRLTDDATTHQENQLICGFIPADSPLEFKNLEDGRVMLSVIGKLWTRYSGKMMDVFSRDKQKSVSVEMEVFDSIENREFNATEITSYCYQGITVLGESVTPAISGAIADLIEFAKKESEEYKHALEEFSSRYESVDFSIPKKVKVNAQKGLDLYKTNGKGGTSVSLATARFLIKNDTITPEKVRKLYSHLEKRVDSFDEFDTSTPDYMSWMLWGGKDGLRWGKKLKEALDQIDSKRMSYFSEDKVIERGGVLSKDDFLTFPYKNVGDINPALKGIVPPISLAQANEIARQADAIGAEKGGWGIAIKHFKDSHKVENNRWIKKETSKNMGENSQEEEYNMGEEKEEGKKEEMAEDKPEEKQTPEEEKKETPKQENKEEKKEKEEQKDEEKKEEMSLDSNVDVAAILEMLKNETEGYQSLVQAYSDGKSDYSMLCSAMFSKMQEMSASLKKFQEDNQAYMSENENLKKYKDGIYAEKFTFEVEKTLLEVSTSMPKTEIDSAREESLKYSLDTVDAWKNLVKAKAFTFSKSEDKGETIVRMQLPFTKTEKNTNSSPWKRP